MRPVQSTTPYLPMSQVDTHYVHKGKSSRVPKERMALRRPMRNTEKEVEVRTVVSRRS